MKILDAKSIRGSSEVKGNPSNIFSCFLHFYGDQGSQKKQKLIHKHVCHIQFLCL